MSKMFYFLLFLISLLVFEIDAGEHILRLQDNLHAATSLIGVEEGSSIIIRCEHPRGKIEALRWLHAGTPINPKYVKTTEVASFVEIKEYEIEKNDGVYECSAPGMSASYRVKGEKKHILPDGFRYCFGEELAKCNHASFCQAEDQSGLISCVCEQGWMGESCNQIDSVRLRSVVTQPVCDYWTPVVTLIAFAAIIVLLVYSLYKFKVHNPHRYSAGYPASIYNNNNNDKPPMVSGEYQIINRPSGNDYNIV